MDHIERLNNLLYWLKLLSTTGWYLVSTIVLIHFNSSRTQSTRGIQLVNNNNNNTRVNNNYQLNNSKENTNTAMHRRIIQLLSKLVRNSLKVSLIAYIHFWVITLPNELLLLLLLLSLLLFPLIPRGI
ncbi:unnamed protein product [Trichobilharzia regenti]|nr:unnamed protein product [Trichobilharzia regenti]